MDLLGMYVMNSPPLKDSYICFDSRFRTKIDRVKRRVRLTFQDKDGTHPITAYLWDNVLASLETGKTSKGKAQCAGIRNVNLIIGQNGTGKTTLSFLIGKMVRQLRTGVKKYEKEFSGLSLWRETEQEARDRGHEQKIYLFWHTDEPWELKVESKAYDAVCCSFKEARDESDSYRSIPNAVLISNSMENRQFRPLKVSDSEPQTRFQNDFPELDSLPISPSSPDGAYSPGIYSSDVIGVYDYTPMTVLLIGNGDSDTVQKLFEERALSSVPHGWQFFDAQTRWILFQLWGSPRLRDIRVAEQESTNFERQLSASETPTEPVLDAVRLVLFRQYVRPETGAFWDKEVKRACERLRSYGASSLDVSFLKMLREMTDKFSATGLSSEVEKALFELIHSYEHSLSVIPPASLSEERRRIILDLRRLRALLELKMRLDWRDEGANRATLGCEDFHNTVVLDDSHRHAVREAIDDYLSVYAEDRTKLPELRLEGSSGQLNYLMLLASLCHAVADERRHYRPILLIVDEADLSFHPEWQRILLLRLLNILKKLLPNNNWHVILATHSPILLSDFPASSRILLPSANSDHAENKTGENDKTFAQNIYRLYQEQMYLSSATGSFAQAYLKKLVTSISSMSKDNASAQYAALKAQVGLIGDPVLRQIYQRQLDQVTMRVLSGDKGQENKLLTELVKEADSKTKELLLTEFVIEADSKTKDWLRELLKES